MTQKMLKFVNGMMVEYYLYDLIDKYDPILKTKCTEFDFAYPPTNPETLSISLLQTMIKYKGLGLAANQVGLKYRVFVMGSGDTWYSCFNPVIIGMSGEEVKEEGCLSHPGLLLHIKRASVVNLKYFDHKGVEKTDTFTGLTAKIIQHEMMHLDGLSFTDMVPKVTLQRAQGKIKRNLKL